MIKATREDLEFELQLRRVEEAVWTTRDGRQVPVKKMSTNHIINTINMIDRQVDFEDLVGEMDPLELYD